jgi:hypothetical protein
MCRFNICFRYIVKLYVRLCHFCVCSHAFMSVCSLGTRVIIGLLWTEHVTVFCVPCVCVSARSDCVSACSEVCVLHVHGLCVHVCEFNLIN